MKGALKLRERKRIILVTGRPGSGKSFLVEKVCERLKDIGYSVGGMLTRDIREGGRRVGFEIVDLNSGERSIMAHVRIRGEARIGKYGVNLDSLRSIGARSIREAVEKADVVVIDEVGPMELKSREFIDAVKFAVESGKPILATIHYRLRNPLIMDLKSRVDSEVLEIDVKNREIVLDEVLRRITEIVNR